ncbi:hypothetical protein ACHAXT_012786 [Thalassiosira profunda]
MVLHLLSESTNKTTTAAQRAALEEEPIDTMDDENKLAAAAFAVFADRLASEAATDAEELKDAYASLTPFRELLGKVEIHAGGQIVASSNLNVAVIVEDTDNPYQHLMVGFPHVATSLPFSKYCRGSGGAKIVAANQTVGVLPGDFQPVVKFGGDEEAEVFIVMTAGGGSCVSVEGQLQNLTANDVHNLATDDKLIGRYLVTGEGLESFDVSFTPQLIHWQMTPGLKRVADLLGPLRKSVDGQPPEDLPVGGAVQPDLVESSPSDTLRATVARACGSSRHLDLTKECMFLNYRVGILTEIRSLVGALEMDFKGNDTPFHIALGEGRLENLGDDGIVWNLGPSDSSWLIPIEKLPSLQVSLSGMALEREDFSFVTSPPRGVVMTIGYHSGIEVKGYFDGIGATSENLLGFLQILMTDRNAWGMVMALPNPPVLMFKILSVTIELPSIENALHLLGIDVGPLERAVELKDPGDMSVKELKAAIAKAGLGQQAVGCAEKRELVDLLRQHRERML